MNLKNSQQDVDTWINEHGVRYFNELTNMAQLTEEVGEHGRCNERHNKADADGPHAKCGRTLPFNGAGH